MFDLYKDLIIDYAKNPQNKKKINQYTNIAKGFNHFCGDNFLLYLMIKQNKIIDTSYEGEGCSISLASASIMTSTIKNKNIQEALFFFDYFKKILNNKEKINNKFEEINILANVRNYPSRIKCATLIWHTMIDAIKNGEIKKYD